jgi:hypothetical protein
VNMPGLKMKFGLYLLLGIAVACLTACSTIEVTRDFDANADFSSYRTFAFISDHPMVSTELDPDPRTEPMIMEAITHHMTAKGFTRVDRDADPDLTIAFTVGSRERMQADNFPAEYQVAYGTWNEGRVGSYGMGSAAQAGKSTYSQGQLAIDLIDRKMKRPVYHTAATKALTPRDLANGDQLVHKVVAKLLYAFPPT